MTNKGAILFSPGPFGGAEKVILESTLELKLPLLLIQEARNMAPSQEFEELLKSKGITYKTFISTKPVDKKLISELQDHIHENQIDFVHSHGMKANFINSYLQVKRVATQHGQTSHSLKTRIMEWIEAQRLKKMHALICVSDEMYKKTHHPQKILIENFIPISASPHSFSFNPDEVFKIVFAGRLSEEKGIRFLLETVSELEGIQLHIYGQGDLEPIVARFSNEKTQNIIYHGFTRDIHSALKSGHALIISSMREGLPMIALESAALGLPILATKVGGLPKLLAHKDKFLVDYGNKQDLKNKILAFKNDYAEYLKEFKQIQTDVIKTYSKESWLEETLAVYTKLS